MKHLLAAGVCLLLALVWSFPLVLQLHDHLPGREIGDNVAFLWNLWWMRHAGASFFFTPYLFAPFGVDLALHTHTALPALVTATVLRGVNLLAAQNVVLIGTLAANAAAMYALAFDRTRSWSGSIAAALIYGGTPFVSAHLLGHFNLVNVWTLPLFLLCLLRAVERESQGWTMGTALVLAATVYTDYYYSVYAVVLAAGVLAWRSGALAIHLAPARPPRAFLTTVALALGVVAGTSALIVITGGIDRTVAGVRIRATEPGNLLTLGWILLAIAAWRCLRPSCRVDWTKGAAACRMSLRLWAPAALVCVFTISPLLVHVVSLLRAGDYVAPPHMWRSGAKGVDLLTLVLGNPLGTIAGPWARQRYAAFGFDGIEGVGWLGVVPACVLLRGTFRARRDRTLLPLVACAWFFLIWALGPWLTIAGENTGLMLPANLFGFLPIVSNARIPGRALAVVFLATALLTARWLQSAGGRPALVFAICSVVILDFLPAPIATVAVTPSPLYTLVPHDSMSVMEVPVGLRDGFGEVGAFDERALMGQTVHEHPLVGGFVARLPPSLTERYADLPVVRSVLAMSAGRTIDLRDVPLTPADATSALIRTGIGYIVLDHAAASPALVSYVTSLQLRSIGRDGDRELLAVQEE
ncbi:MAG: hypothetical protein QM736_20795 [Vicinamibacterales bacterium]